MVFSNPVSSSSLIKSDKLRPLAISSKPRSPLFPNVPTVAESGVPGYEAQSWYGVLAPAGTPQNVVSVLNAAINKVLVMPDVRQQIAVVGGVTQGGTPHAFDKLIREDIARWSKLAASTPALRSQ